MCNTYTGRPYANNQAFNFGPLSHGLVNVVSFYIANLRNLSNTCQVFSIIFYNKNESSLKNPMNKAKNGESSLNNPTKKFQIILAVGPKCRAEITLC